MLWACHKGDTRLNARADEFNKIAQEQQGGTAFSTPTKPSFADTDNYLLEKLAERDNARREDTGGTRFERNARDRKPTWGSAREAINRAEAPENESSSDDAAAIVPTPAQTEQKTTPPASDEPPSYFHSLNDRQARLEQQLAESAQRERQHQEYLQRLAYQQQQQLAAQQAPPDNLHEQLGLPPDALAQFENRVLQKAHQMQAPLMAQLAHEKWENAFHQAAKSHEHFSKYFTIEQQRQIFNRVLSTRPLQETMSINWAKEFEQVYDVADAPRRKKAEADKDKRIAELEAQLAGKTQGKQQEKKEKTNNLHLVPKANQQGSSPLNSANSLDDYKPGEGRKRRMSDLSRFLKRKHELA